jgi:hypothetical protein
MSEQHNWYTTIPERDRAIVDAAAKWLRPVSWQWFVTLTFPWNVRSETADFKLKKWLNQIEKTLKSRVCFVAGKERKPHSDGMEVPWHFHVLVTSTVAIPQGLLEDRWKRLVSLGARCLQKDNAVDDSVLVTPFKNDLKGPEYCLKSLNSCNGDWHFRWLELFNPRIRQTGSPNHLTIRQRVRFAARLDVVR